MGQVLWVMGWWVFSPGQVRAGSWLTRSVHGSPVGFCTSKNVVQPFKISAHMIGPCLSLIGSVEYQSRSHVLPLSIPWLMHAYPLDP